VRRPHPREVGPLTGLPYGGTVAAGFELVRDAFENNFAEHGEIGASACLSVQGRVVVDIWGGWSRPDHSAPWEADTLVNAFSVGKGLTAIVAAMLVDPGRSPTG